MDKRIILILLFLPFLAKGQTYLDCAPDGPLLELQLNTEIANDKFFYSNGSCIKGGVTNGGLELIAGTLSIIDGDTIGQVLRWTGTTWEPRLIIFHGGGGGVDTVYNGLTDRDTAFVLGGPLVEHTRVQGQKAYDITWDDMRTVYIEAQRTGGVAYSSLTMGSTAIQGVDFFHYNEATPAKQAVVGINYSSGNIMKLQEAYDNGTYINQYDPGGGAFRTDIYAANAVYSQTFRVDRNGMYMLYPDITDVANEAAFLMIDTLTWKVLRKSPADFTGLYGDNWGSQTVSSTARFSGNGTSGNPLELAQQSATTGQVMKWNGTSWAPGTDSGNAPDSTFGKGSYYFPSYAGKAITSNVFRRAKTGFETRDTVGVVNIKGSFDAATTKPAVYIADSTNYLLIAQKDATADSCSDFQMVLRHFDNVSDAGDNSVFSMGFNVSDGGGKVDATKAGASLRIESKYDITSGGGSTPGFEFHLPQVNFKTGTGSNRPLTGWFGHERTFGGYWSFDSDRINFNDYKDGTQRAFWGLHPNSGVARGISFIDSAGIYFYKNNYEGIRMRNAANTSFINLIKADSDNQVLLGGFGESRVSAYNHLRVTNGGLITNENGDIIIGNATYPTRLNLETNGSGILILKRTGATYTNTLSIFNSQFYYQSSNGNTPFMVDLTAPSYSLWVRETGRVGFGTASPQKQMHLYGTGGATTGLFRIENTTGSNDIYKTNATPEGVISAVTGDLALSNISGAGNLWIKKESSGANTGWAKAVTGIEDKTINSYFREVALPTTVNNTVYLGIVTFLGGGGVGHAEIVVSAEDGGTGVAITKEFILPNVYSATGGSWQTMLPTSSTGNRLGEDFSLEIRSSLVSDSLRIRRTAGTNSSNVRASIIFKNTSGLAATYFTNITKTWNSPAVPSTVFNYNSYTAEKNKFGVMTAAPAQTFHVQGTARITGSDGTATGLMGRDADGDISNVSVGSALGLASGTLNVADSGVSPGTYGNHNKFVEIDVNAKGQITDIQETAFNITTYASSGGPTTTTLQHDDYIVEADPTAGDLTIQLGSQENGRVYHIFGCCNLTNDIILQGSGMKFTGAYGTTSSDYTFGPGEHLEIIYRSSNSTYYISKK